MSVKRKSYFTIVLMIVLMLSAIIVLDISWESSHEEARLNFEKEDYTPSLPTESGVFRRSQYALEYQKMAENESNSRSLDTYYENRAYPGAPPTIPHPLLSEKGIGSNNCLQCHEHGGYVAKFEAYAPVTPHPEMINCLQCHVPVKTNSNFALTDWKKIKHPEVGNSALEGSPPPIPHTLQMRENCLACHAGPAAPKEIKVSHPLRINCRQCHVPVTDLSTLNVEWDSTAQFVRSPK